MSETRESGTTEPGTTESATTEPATTGSATTGTFVRVCALADVPEQGAIGLDVGGEPVAVIRVDGDVFALRDVCSHEEVPLSEGEVYNHTVECWLHGSCFDLRTGAPTGPPATRPVPTYPVKVDGGDVYVAIPAAPGS